MSHARTARILTVAATAAALVSLGATAFAAPRATSGGTPVGPDATGPANVGLCTAYFASTQAHPTNLRAVAFQNLIAAAAGSGQTVAEYCGATSTIDTTSTDGSGATSTTDTTSEFSSAA